jgi:hypothetical protein
MKRVVSQFLFLLLITLISVQNLSCGKANVRSDEPNTAESKDLKYYSTQSNITEPGRYTYLYDGLDQDVNSLVAAVQGVLVHGAHLHGYGITLSEERIQKQEHTIRKVENMLARIDELDDRPLKYQREPDKRLVASCRSYSVLLCSLLRHLGVPARTRGGFETYFYEDDYYHDHWICEYWSAKESRWIQVDAQIDDIQRAAMGIKVNTLDLPAGAFITGGGAWKLCREDKKNPNQFGIWDAPNNRWVGGWDFVKSEVILDLMALNKTELLPWDGNKLSDKGYEDLNDVELDLLDHVSEATNSEKVDFDKVISIHSSNPSLQMPESFIP